MIRNALTDAAYDANASTLPKGAARWPMPRDWDQCFIEVQAAVVDRMRATRRPVESYSEVRLPPKMTPAQITEAQRMTREWQRLGAPGKSRSECVLDEPAAPTTGRVFCPAYGARWRS